MRIGPVAALTPLALAGLSATLYVAAQPPWNASLLVWVAFVPLLVALPRIRPGWAALLGAGFGLAIGFGVGSWLPGTVATFFDVEAPGALLAVTVYLVTTVALPWAAAGAALAALARAGLGSPLVAAALLAATELARAHAPVANPWGQIAHALPPGSIWLQSADLLGSTGPALAVALGNGALAALFQRAWRPHRRAAVAALIAILLASALGYGAWRERTPFGDGGPVKVALLHDATVPGVAPSGAEPESAFARRLGLGRDAAAAGAHLVIWPELSLPRVLDGSGLPDPLEEVFRATSAWWLVGAAVERRRLDGVDRWNSALLFHDARLRGRHDKLDLLPFAEDERASVFLGRTPRGWERGERLRPLRTEALSIGPLICSEALLPELARAMVQSGATVLANPSYDGWYPTDGAREQALRVAALRAVENRRWLLRSTIGGATAAVDPVGASRPLREPGGPGVVEVTIRNVEEITVYARHGEGPALAAIAVCLGLGVALAYRPRSGGA